MTHKKQWEFLKKNFEANQLAHAYLFAGQENLGKEKFAKNFIEFTGCRFPDFMSVCPDEGGEIPIAKIREVQNFLSYKPYYGNLKAVIAKDAEKMNQEAQSCFLKTLEEPRGNSLIILISSKPNLLLPTICSRCQLIKFFGKPALSPEKRARENKILQELLKIIPLSLSEKFKYAKSIDFEQQGLREMLDVLQKHYRQQLLEAVSADSPVLKLKKDIELIQEINNKITFTNASPKLALEILLMNI